MPRMAARSSAWLGIGSVAVRRMEDRIERFCRAIMEEAEWERRAWQTVAA